MTIDATSNQGVMQPWTVRMTLRMQGVLVQALRGPDGYVKESSAKPIVRSLRGISMVSAGMGGFTSLGLQRVDDDYMTTAYIGDEDGRRWRILENHFFDEVDAYNLHFYQHLMQAFACAGCAHPNDTVRGRCWSFYEKCADAIHLYPETPAQLQQRLKDGPRNVPHD